MNEPVLARMAALIEQWQQAADARSDFLSCYALMTGNMLRAVDNRDFHDPAWVGQLLQHFADYYFVALDGYERGDDATPEVWRLAHDATRQPGTQTVQLLLLGINAHINYDLVLALTDMLEPDWAALTPEQRQQRYEDHARVNAVIAATVDSVQDQVLSPQARWLGWMDAVLGPVDERLAARIIRNWREEVWQQAQHMLATQDVEERADLRRLLSVRSVALGEAILAMRLSPLLGDLL